MDEFLNFVVDAIALHGYEGCSVFEVWRLLSKKKADYWILSGLEDSYICRLIWEQLLSIPFLSVYKSDPAGARAAPPKLTHSGALYSVERKLQSKDGAAFASVDAQRDHFHIVADFQLRCGALGLNEGGVGQDKDGTYFCIVELIGKKREAGISQVDLAKVS